MEPGKYGKRNQPKRRITMKKMTIVMAFVLSIGTLLAQQGPPFRGPRPGNPPLDALKSYLQLNDKQVTDLTALLATFRDTVKPIHEQIMAKEKELRQEMGKASPDSSLVAQLMVDVKNLRGQIKSKRSELSPQLLALLSDTQKGLLSNLQQALSIAQAAHQAAALGLIEGPANAPFDGEGFGGGRRGMHAGPMNQP
jgi:hypothetical protein